MDSQEKQYAQETDNPNEVIHQKLREHFDGKIVRKDLTKAIKEGANVPVYVLEFLLGQYCSSDDPKIIEDGVKNVKRKLQENKPFFKALSASDHSFYILIGRQS